jgi:hypothetical protein
MDSNASHAGEVERNVCRTTIFRCAASFIKSTSSFSAGPTAPGDPRRCRVAGGLQRRVLKDSAQPRPKKAQHSTLRAALGVLRSGRAACLYWPRRDRNWPGGARAALAAAATSCHFRDAAAGGATSDKPLWFTARPRRVHWVRPELVVEVKSLHGQRKTCFVRSSTRACERTRIRRPSGAPCSTHRPRAASHGRRLKALARGFSRPASSERKERANHSSGGDFGGRGCRFRRGARIGFYNAARSRRPASAEYRRRRAHRQRHTRRQ